MKEKHDEKKQTEGENSVACDFAVGIPAVYDSVCLYDQYFLG